MNNDRSVYIVAISALLILLALIAIGRFPGAYIIIILLIALRIASYFMIEKFNNMTNAGSVTAERINALKEAQIYLAPYKSIWKNLKLTNRYIVVRLGSDGRTIECEEKVYPYRHMRLGASPIFSDNEVWNQICKYFSWNKSYNGIVEDCNRYKIRILESISADKEPLTVAEENNATDITMQKTENKKAELPLIDINNCSEIELTELPGISIVHAKKIIKKREEIGGFKNVNEFYTFLKLKQHIINQLKDRIKVEKMKGAVHRKLNQERSIDF